MKLRILSLLSSRFGRARASAKLDPHSRPDVGADGRPQVTQELPAAAIRAPAASTARAGAAFALITLASAVVIGVACNSLLDNSPGVLVESDAAAPHRSPVATTAPPDSPPDSSPGADGGEGSPDAGTVEPPPGCPVGQRLCNGACVGLTDPLYGCGDPSCAPCPSTRSAMGCQGSRCIVTACDPGYANCNGDPADGCETDLSKPASCGACNAQCAVAAPLCAPAGPTFQCTNGCTADAPVKCGNDCVDLMTSTNHCGGCSTACPVVANATIACVVGACGFTCRPLFHACAGACVADTSPTACGPACAVCPVPAGGTATCLANVCGTSCPPPSHLCAGSCVTNAPTACGAACTACPARANAIATCLAETCGFACTAGFGNCDLNAANGCEASFASDPLHCGGCARSCAGQPCVNGVCQAPPPPPPPPLP
ncbi:hypothetical protein BH11MYX4_BH11MYX4_15240 [soil metagenome]